MLVFPLIPHDIRTQLPNSSEVEFVHPHNLGSFAFQVKKTTAGFYVVVRPAGASADAGPTPPEQFELEHHSADSQIEIISPEADPSEQPASEPVAAEPVAAAYAAVPQFEAATLTNLPSGFIPPVEEYVPPGAPPVAAAAAEPAPSPMGDDEVAVAVPLVDRRQYDRRRVNSVMQDRMEALFRQMAEAGASDLHLSVSMPPLIRKDGKIQPLECQEDLIDEPIMNELLTSIMPEKNREEFAARNDTDFAYEITGLARFRCNVFRDRKGMGGVFRIIPSEILTAETLGLSKAVMDLCSLSKGLVVVTGPTGSGKSTTLCAMIDSINKTREDHIITIEDPIEFVHDNQKCLINQREVHNHTDSFKDALRAALREDPDILLVGEMRDLETISIAIETAETGHLVFGTLHTTTAASTVDRIIDQFPADRQQQIRVMLSESLKGVIAQTLLPKKGGGRVAALEILIVTPAISNLIREGKTFQIPSAMQTGKNVGMVMLNDALYDLVEKGIVEPKDAYVKAVDKTGFGTMLTRGGHK
ncbi:MAG: type IV pilus twitching motility protein PilT, partial [Blastocatellia bacterium]|nr:type IV pilus twitching motility protein PilT [Blastocatellia bacterium]